MTMKRSALWALKATVRLAEDGQTPQRATDLAALIGAPHPMTTKTLHQLTTAELVQRNRELEGSDDQG